MGFTNGRPKLNNKHHASVIMICAAFKVHEAGIAVAAGAGLHASSSQAQPEHATSQVAKATTKHMQHPKVWEGKNSLKTKFWARIFLGHQGPRCRGIQDKKLYASGLFLLF